METDDSAEVFNRPVNSSNDDSRESFKKPILIGKRPGVISKHGTVVKQISDSSPNLDSVLKQSSPDQNSSVKNESESSKSEDDSAKKNNKPEVSIMMKKSPQNKNLEMKVDYKEPSWSGCCDKQYNVEVLKNGTIIQNEDLTTKAFHIFGRLPTCNFVLEHPSISRFHAILQYRNATTDQEHPIGWYLYDLGSTHGTFLNKRQITPRVYCRVRPGHVFKFGVSTRLFILQGPEEDQEPESELSVTELIELKKQRESISIDDLDDDDNLRNSKVNSKSDEILSTGSTGIDWGMGEDAKDENPLAENPFAIVEDNPLHEDVYLDDPKKTLRGWFEREGYELEYKVEEKSYANFVCRVDLPIDTPNGAPVIAEAVVKGGKKKEAVVQCALEACRILDRHGLLRQSHHEGKSNRRKRPIDEDYYSSDEDTFLDRTGAVERKRQARLKGKLSNSVETYDSLMEKLKTIEKEMTEVQASISKAFASSSNATNSNAEDDLDAYMSSLQAETSNPRKSKAALKVKLVQLEKEKAKLLTLIKIARPAISLSVKTDVYANTKVEEKETQVIQMQSSSPSSSNADDPTSVPVAKTEMKVPSTVITPKKSEVKSSTERSKRNISGPLLPPELLKQLKEEELSKEKVEEKKEGSQFSEPAEDEIEDNVTSGLVIRKQNKKKSSKKNQRTLESPKDIKVEYASDSDKYAMWIPPDDQSGDGKTNLNKKLGY